ncbi:2',3'-cyclic-nucleotide 2'-phosphodiesterase (5'-nucleotidase family) [Scopulibacillus darangshiensis]|uniref:2',3'-cyclic-nucleotide 2'-phosphodiesterase (5'-nucleotidase family) n=1 Tax=Scopulibacillus darangshiensis TaxID=442528 RepID=A0A4R2NDB4_9BACL|nr:bifunctional UDP-sugar hydrolase/5'-nucleotidase [Scopulibacillus darangshiensis]TCP19130.1 2',3'-cyclic-nucleotide 2'-phosphodiesterase (5'-nucleotidase family) [Scopulibacillus darangshiensis]
MIKLHFYHTNDLHSHFDHWASLVTCLNQLRQKHADDGDPYLVLDLGDHMDRFNPLTEGTMGKGNVTLLNEAGYDYITIGNNEGVTLTKDALSAAYQDRSFKILLANLYDLNGERPEWCHPYTIYNINGVKVGMTAVTAPFVPFYSRLGWDIRDPFTELKEIMKILRQEADVIVLMSHAGLPFDKRAAEEIEGIDVILGAHTHHLLENGLRVGPVLIAQTGKFGHYLGHVAISYDEVSQKVIQKEASIIPLDQEPDQDTDELLSHITRDGATQLQKVVATLDYQMHTEWFGDSELPLLMAEALREWCQGDIGMVNAGVILEDLEAGEVTKADIHRICPHPINPCKVPLKGEQIKAMVEKGIAKDFQTYELKGFGFRGKVLGKLVFSGLTYRLSDENDVCIKDIKINGELIDMGKIYSVATTDMFTFGKLLTEVKLAKQKDYYLPEMLRDLLAWKLKEDRHSH